MKAISLNPPYGTLIAACQRFPDLGKHIETRGQQWSYRGPLLIHQTAGLGTMFADEDELADFCEQEPFRSTLQAMGITHASQLPRGAIVARCLLAGCVPTKQIVAIGGAFGPGGTGLGRLFWRLTERERAFGNYEPGRYGLLLADVQAIEPPVPARGFPGIWEFEGLL